MLTLFSDDSFRCSRLGHYWASLNECGFQGTGALLLQESWKRGACVAQEFLSRTEDSLRGFAVRTTYSSAANSFVCSAAEISRQPLAFWPDQSGVKSLLPEFSALERSGAS